MPIYPSHLFVLDTVKYQNLSYTANHLAMLAAFASYLCVILCDNTAFRGRLRMSASKPSGSATTGASDLSRAPIDLLSLRNDAKGELMDILDLEASKVDEDSDADSDGGGGAADGRGSAQANTCLVLDPRLGGALTLVVTEGPKLFKKHGVKDMIELSWVLLATSCSTVYLVRPEIDNMKMVGRIFSFIVCVCLMKVHSCTDANNPAPNFP